MALLLQQRDPQLAAPSVQMHPHRPRQGAFRLCAETRGRVGSPVQRRGLVLRVAAAEWTSADQHGVNCEPAVFLNPFILLTPAKVLALKATLLLLLTLLIKARIRITAFSALGIVLLLLQTLVFLAVSGGLVLAAGGAVLYTTQMRRPQAT